MNLDSFFSILTIAITAGIISTQAIQFIKDKLKINNSYIFALSSFIIGFLFSISFTNLNIVESLWCGFVSIIGAENLYKSFEGSFGLKSSKK